MSDHAEIARRTLGTDGSGMFLTPNVHTAQVHATLALVEEAARLADAQETANKLAALHHHGLISAKHRASLIGQIGASLYGGEPHA